MHPYLRTLVVAGALAGGAAVPAIAAAPAPAVTVAITPTPQGFELRAVNTTDEPQTPTVTQEMPAGATTTAVSDGGTVTASTVTWHPAIAPHATAVLSTALAPPSRTVREVSSICAADGQTGRLLDCTSSVADRGPAGQGTAPWYRSLWLLTIPVVGGTGWLLWRLRKGVPRLGGLRRAVPFLAAVGVAGIAVGGFLVVRPYLDDSLPSRQLVGDAGWYGEQHQTQLGIPTSDGPVEFTVHRVSCTATNCLVTAEARNTSGADQVWYQGMQRLYTTPALWAGPDTAATLRANGGTDVFAQPLTPGQRVVFALSFPVPQDAAPLRLELREGPAARGVYLNLR